MREKKRLFVCLFVWLVLFMVKHHFCLYIHMILLCIYIIGIFTIRILKARDLWTGPTHGPVKRKKGYSVLKLDVQSTVHMRTKHPRAVYHSICMYVRGDTYLRTYIGSPIGHFTWSDLYIYI